MTRTVSSSARCHAQVLVVLLPLIPLSTTTTTTTNALIISTFNILAPIHRSMKGEHNDDDENNNCDSNNNGIKSSMGSAIKKQKQILLQKQQQQQPRESEREDWWLPRAESVANYIATKFAFSDIIPLQEWWFDDKFTAVFDLVLGDAFERAAERRPGAHFGTMRDDGMCCLVRRKGALVLITSEQILTGSQRIAQIIHCKENSSYAGEDGRHIFIANSHLSFPGDADPLVNDQRQVMEARLIVDALTRAGNEWVDASSSSKNERLEVVCGDFNSNSQGLAALTLEAPPYNFVNCASATAEQMLAHIGGQVNIGVTHCNHLGEKVSVDHIFLRSIQTKAIQQTTPSNTSSCNDTASATNHEISNRCSALALGYLDSKGTRILSVWSDNIHLEGSSVLSDHRPVTAKIAWPRSTKPKKEATLLLDPFQPVWGIVSDEFYSP